VGVVLASAVRVQRQEMRHTFGASYVQASVPKQSLVFVIVMRVCVMCVCVSLYVCVCVCACVCASLSVCASLFLCASGLVCASVCMRVCEYVVFFIVAFGLLFRPYHRSNLLPPRSRENP